jgi:hypothetical protein
MFIDGDIRFNINIWHCRGKKLTWREKSGIKISCKPGSVAKTLRKSAVVGIE